ncbi:hypothetical protein [Marinimicrobium agarilyticum]|uniref:hypothetical protein n=1 Tax=Marinimicrobium agarilyticum TaxID=306546 RepID=UPI0004245FAE|nr:hypothetical protein [Marinimicrobium agarilyticum]
MNPFTLLGGGGGGGPMGGATSSAESSATSGPVTSTTTTGTKNFSFGGGNPNTMTGVISNPMVLVAVVAGVYLVVKG